MKDLADVAHESEFREYLEYCGWRFEQSREGQLPPIRDDLPDLYRDIIPTLRDYLFDSFLIFDPFGEDNHTRRAASTYAQEINPRLTEWVDQHSKLRSNRIFPCITAMFAIAEYFTEIADPLAETLTQIRDQAMTPPNYSTMPLSEKISYVQKLDDHILGFVSALSPP